jgi:hypothetical protein
VRQVHPRPSTSQGQQQHSPGAAARVGQVPGIDSGPLESYRTVQRQPGQATEPEHDGAVQRELSGPGVHRRPAPAQLQESRRRRATCGSVTEQRVKPAIDRSSV